MNNRHDMARLLGKWTLLVWMNAAASFVLALEEHQDIADILGMVCGVFTFVALYAAVDYRLAQRGLEELRSSLAISAIIKALTQLYPVIEMVTGVLAISAVNLTGLDLPFVTVYLMTMVDGTLLTLVVSIFMLAVLFVRRLIARRFRAKSPP